jgi:hypothetical protein
MSCSTKKYGLAFPGSVEREPAPRLQIFADTSGRHRSSKIPGEEKPVINKNFNDVVWRWLMG